MPEWTIRGAAVIACAAAILASACQNYGDMPPYDGSGGAEADVEAEAVDEPAGDSVEEPVEDPPADCIAGQTPVLSPGHGPGTLCVSCHGMYLPIMTLGGTLYADDMGMAPVMGATILVTDAAGTEVRMVTTLNGNFYTDRVLTPPLIVVASRCPDQASMISTASSGECNGCHGPGMRMHLP